MMRKLFLYFVCGLCVPNSAVAGGSFTYLAKLMMGISLMWGGGASSWYHNQGEIDKEEQGYGIHYAGSDKVIVAGGAEVVSGAGMYASLSAYNTSSGALLWQRAFVSGGHNSQGHDVTGSSDGGYVMLGEIVGIGAGGKDLLVVKVDSSGTNMICSYAIGGVNDDIGNKIKSTDDGGFIIVGYTNSYDFFSLGASGFIMKLNSTCGEEWFRTIAGAYDDSWEDVAIKSDGSFFVIGSTESYARGDRDIVAITFSSAGNWVEAVHIGLPLSRQLPYSMALKSDGSFGLVGCFFHPFFGMQQAFWLFDSSGDLAYAKTFALARFGRGTEIVATATGYAIVGSSPFTLGYNYDLFFMHVGNNGVTEWFQTVGHSDNKDLALGFTLDEENNYLLAGSIGKSHGTGDHNLLVGKFVYETQGSCGIASTLMSRDITSRNKKRSFTPVIMSNTTSSLDIKNLLVSTELNPTVDITACL